MEYVNILIIDCNRSCLESSKFDNNNNIGSYIIN